MKKLNFWKYRGFTTNQVKAFVDGNEVRTDLSQIPLRFILLIVAAIFLGSISDVNFFGGVLLFLGLVGAYLAGMRYRTRFSRAETFRYLFATNAIGIFFLMIAEIRLFYRAFYVVLPVFLIVLVFQLLACLIAASYFVNRVERGYGSRKQNKVYFTGYVFLFMLYLFSDSLFSYHALYLVQGVILLAASALMSLCVKYLICYRLLLNESRGYYDAAVSVQSVRTVRSAKKPRNKAVRNAPKNRYETDGGGYQEAQPRYQTGISPQVKQEKLTPMPSVQTKAPEEAVSFRKADGTMDFDAALANINNKINALGERFNETVVSATTVPAEAEVGNGGNGFPESVVPGQLERASDESKR
ncbi:MAG: hypothetical protein ACC608_06260 [Anaerofustis sp.]